MAGELCPHGSDTSKWLPGSECSHCIREMLSAMTQCWAIGHAPAPKRIAKIGDTNDALCPVIFQCTRCKQLFAV